MPDTGFTAEISSLRKRLAAIFAAAAICILAGGLAYHHHYQQALRRDAADLLSAIKRFKTDQILFWRSDRFNDTNSLLDTPVLSKVLNSFAADTSNAALREQLRARLTSYLKHNKYRSALLARPDGRVATAAGENTGPLPPEAKALITKAIASGKTEIGDFYLGPSGRPRMDVVSRAAAAPGGKTLYLVLELAPDDYLYPLLQTWPTSSRTGETVLARKDGRDILFLGDLRKTSDAGMKLRLPLSNSRLPIARALNGEEGIYSGEDYHGDKVLAAIGLIPGTNWGIVVKADWDELMAASGRLSALVLLFTLFLVATAGGWAYLLFRLEAERYSRTLADIETEKERYKFNFEMLADKANDMFLLADPVKRSLLMVNKKTCETYGYTEEEMLQLRPENLIPPENIPMFNKRFSALANGEGAVYEVTHIKKDGTRFPIEVSATGVTQGGRNLVFFICRDITERKEAQRALKEREAVLREAQSVARLGSYVFDIQADSWSSSEEMDSIFGLAENQEKTMQTWSSLLAPEDRQMMTEYFSGEVLGKGLPFNKEYRIIRASDGEKRWVHGMGRLEFTPDGRPSRMIGTIQDITERKKSDEALRATEDRYQQLFEKMEEGFATHEVICDEAGIPVDYRWLKVNPAFERLTGLKKEQVEGRRALEVLPGLEPDWVEKLGNVALTGVPAHFENRVEALGRWYEVSVFSPAKGMFAVNFYDITPQKEAAIKLEEANREMRKNLRLYTLLAHINQAAAQTKSIKALYQQLCEVAVSSGSFKLAWVGYPDRDTGRVLPICSAGAPDGYLDHIKISAKDGPNSKGPEGTAARTGRVSACQDIETDPDMLPWREEALKRGFRSAAAVPLYEGTALTAVLSLYSADKNFFTEDEIRLLGAVKGDVSLAIESISSGEKHGLAQNALERTTTHLAHMMEASPVVLFTLRQVNGRMFPQWVSGNSEAVTGYEPSEMLSPEWFGGVVHPEDKAWVLGEMSQIFKKGAISHDFRLNRKDGTYTWLHAQLRAGPESSGEVTGSWTDITPLKESELRFRKLFEKSPLACRPPEQAGRDEIYLAEPESGRLTFASAGALKALGYTRPEIESRFVFDIMTDLNAETFRASITPLVKKQKPLLIIETDHRRKDGSAYAVQSRVQLLEGATGAMLLIVATELREDAAK